MAYTVKAVADLAGISIRALHHYDRIGLLKPTSASPAGYRLYTERDLERLQQILFFKELDFPLQDIKTIIESPGFDRHAALISHRQLLLAKQARLQTLVRSIDRTIEMMEARKPMPANTLFEGFDEAQQRQYREEARQRWGSERVDDSERRTAPYTRDDWAAIQQAMAEINHTVAAHLGGDPAHPDVQAAVAHWHRLINERFYDCSLEVFRGLGDLYVDDERFTATYDKVKPGLAPFLRAAMHAYCDRQESMA